MLSSVCEQHLTKQQDTEEFMTAEQLAQNLLTLLHSERCDDEIQAGLVDVLGFDNMDLLMKLVTHRKSIVEKTAGQVSSEIGLILCWLDAECDNVLNDW
jgi:hypothetical protein